MADPDRLKKALRAAHAAGDTESAKRIARMIKAQSAPVKMPSEAANPAPQSAPTIGGFTVGGFDPNKPASAGLIAGGLPPGVGGAAQTPEAAALAAEIGQRKREAAATPANSGILGFAQGGTLGFADEIGAAAIAPFTEGTYSDVLAAIRGGNEAAASANPLAYLGGQVAGSIAPGAAVLRPVAAAPTLAGRVAIGSGAGAGIGAVQGFGSGEGMDGRLSGAEAGALGGAIVGGAIPLLGAAARAGIDRFAQSRAVKAALASADTPESLREAASAIYKQADEVGNLPRGRFADAVGDITDAANRRGLDPDLTPGAAKVADRMATAAADESDNIGFRELDILRRKAAIPAGNFANETEQGIASEMIEGIDDFIDAVDPSLSSAIKEARNMWGRLRRSDLVSRAIEKAKNAPSGFENGLRIEFRKILSNPKLRRGFNAREIEAVERVVRGSASGNIMRQVGRLGLGISGQSNAVGATMGGILGATLGGPVGGLATVAAGSGFKALSERSTRKAAENALATILARNALDAMPAPQMLPGAQNALSAIGFGGLPTAAPEVGNYVLGRQ